MKKTTGPQLKLRGIEKLLIVLIAVLPLLIGVVIVYSSASLSSSNIEVEKLKEKTKDIIGNNGAKLPIGPSSKINQILQPE